MQVETGEIAATNAVLDGIAAELETEVPAELIQSPDEIAEQKRMNRRRQKQMEQAMKRSVTLGELPHLMDLCTRDHRMAVAARHANVHTVVLTLIDVLHEKGVIDKDELLALASAKLARLEQGESPVATDVMNDGDEQMPGIII